MRRFVPFIVFALVLVIPSLVAGQPCPPIELNVSQEPPEQQWWMVLLDFLLQLVSPIAIAVLTTLGSIAIQRWGKKMDVDKREALIRVKDNMVKAGIGFAEEQGRKALRHGGTQTEGAQKLSAATSFVNQQLESSGLKRIAETELVGLIESRLAQERAKPNGVIPSDPVVTVNGGAADTLVEG